jgi:hypothetical protein
MVISPRIMTDSTIVSMLISRECNQEQYQQDDVNAMDV